jgi:hypothetical protein
MSEFRDQLERTRKSDSSGDRKGMPIRRCDRWSTCLSGLLTLLLLVFPASVSAVRARNLNFIVQVLLLSNLVYQLDCLSGIVHPTEGSICHRSARSTMSARSRFRSKPTAKAFCILAPSGLPPFGIPNMPR